jgi:hypothetical protein
MIKDFGRWIPFLKKSFADSIPGGNTCRGFGGEDLVF